VQVDTASGPVALTTQCPGSLSGTWQVTTRACIVVGLVLSNESDTDAATVDLYSGPATGGELLAVVVVPAGQTFTFHGGLLGLVAQTGLTVKVTTGTLTPSITTAVQE
jgi:hypothetical protein